MGGSLAKTGNPFGGGAQIGAWGEKKALINKTLVALEQLLPTIPESAPAQAATPSTDGSSGSLVVQLRNLTDLMEKGALTDEEFQVAKSRLLTNQ